MSEVCNNLNLPSKMFCTYINFEGVFVLSMVQAYLLSDTILDSESDLEII